MICQFWKQEEVKRRKTVYGLKAIRKEVQGLTIEPIFYGPDKNYFEAGTRKSITCKGANKNQKVEWVDPSGKVVQRLATNRVFTQEHFVSTFRSRVPAMVLILTKATVEDTGVWQCRSGDFRQNVSLCIIEPSEFLETPTEVSVDRGRSITLSCQAKGEPEPRLVWYRHDTIISDDYNPSKYQIMTKYNSEGFEGLLTITSLEGEDSGVYNCFAIQESSYVDGCSASISMNITLHVNYAPTFSDGNDTTLVPVQEKKSTDLECVAEGYPTPTYRWFKEVGDILSEFPSSDIKLEDDGEKAILSITADESTFGQRYKCRASNKYGSAEKSFAVIKLEKPTRPTEIVSRDHDHDALNFIAQWDEEIYFPVEEFQIQYIESKLLRKKSGQPREVDWKRSEEVLVKNNEFGEMESGGTVMLIKLDDLKEETEYWVRFKAVNDAGESAWSEPILASTVAKPEEEIEIPEEGEETSEPKADAQVSNGTFYGVFFAGGIIVVILGATFLIRMV
ncbi:hypothetical protein KGM_201986 [Danaus plexippus plexippus]|uniref:Ig-like domain-containing protein n=1 Tax=Danaus plexippus plexippus TaxID=278856 RepID=A0A212F9T9_DANPL|nr:hypothetical protein KGM_201986 [Danaus plexippus plexippus]